MPSIGIRLLSDLRNLFGDREAMTTESILSGLHEMDESPWGDIRGKPLNDRGLASRLRPYGIKPKVVRIGESTHRGYARVNLVDAWERYLGTPPHGTVTCVTCVTNAHAAGACEEGEV